MLSTRRKSSVLGSHIEAWNLQGIALASPIHRRSAETSHHPDLGTPLAGPQRKRPPSRCLVLALVDLHDVYVVFCAGNYPSVAAWRRLSLGSHATSLRCYFTSPWLPNRTRGDGELFLLQPKAIPVRLLAWILKEQGANMRSLRAVPLALVTWTFRIKA